MAKMAKTCQKLVMKNLLDPQNSIFSIKDKKNYIYAKCRPYMGLHSCQFPGLLKKF